MSRDLLDDFFSVVRRPKTYKNMLYLLLSFPTGLIYFITLITAFSVGIATLVILIGIPVILGTFALIRFYMGVERMMTNALTETDIPPIPSFEHGAQKFTERMRLLILSPYSWRGLFLLIIRFFLGIINFSITASILTTDLILLTAPFHYRRTILPAFPDTVMLPVPPESIGIITAIIGLFLAVLLCYITNAMAKFSAELTKSLLNS